MSASGRLLAIDVGNTQIKVGVFEGDRLVAVYRIPHGKWPATATAIREAVGSAPEWAGAVLASVVPTLDRRLLALCRSITGKSPRVIDHTADLGLSVTTRHPEAVGADRLVNAAAAHLLFGGPLVVVDMGTAITVCAVTGAGQYLGGSIAPGPQLALDALSGRTAKLPRVRLQAPPQGIGRDTVEAMQVGAVLGFAGLVDRLIAETLKGMGQPAGARVYLTGGLASLFSPLLGTPHEVCADLTLRGLHLLFQRQA